MSISNKYSETSLAISEFCIWITDDFSFHIVGQTLSYPGHHLMKMEKRKDVMQYV